MVWRWWVQQAADTVASLRAAAMCLSAVNNGAEAIKLLDRADKIESDGPQSSATTEAWSQETGKRVYKEHTGVDVDDPETKAKLLAAEAAMKRMDRERADAAAIAAENVNTRTSKSRQRLLRRGRKS